MSKAFTIRRATVKDLKDLSILAAETFLQSHGHSASEEDISSYVKLKYNTDSMRTELQDPTNIYYIALDQTKAIGFSKIILNTPCQNSSLSNLTCLERIYVLKEYHGSGLGMVLWNENLNQAIKNNQQGIWLNVWIENLRAISFYKKLGFKIIGAYNFEISTTHSNPNHQMLLKL